jgi:diguanylate cyclase (GGDEF)-like protein
LDSFLIISFLNVLECLCRDALILIEKASTLSQGLSSRWLARIRRRCDPMALKKSKLNASFPDDDPISIINGDFDEQIRQLKQVLRQCGQELQTTEDQDRLNRAVTEASHILEAMRRTHEQVSDEAIRDGLTGLYNRRYFEREKIRQFNLAASQKEDLALLMIDVDHFGQVNKQYGHETGDALLKIVSQAIAQTIRGSDLLFRFGGDEFVLILPKTNYEEALQIASRVLQMVPKAMKNVLKGKRNLDILSQVMDVRELTLSMGLFHHKLPDALLDSAEDFLRFADFAANRAKQSGRNQLTVAILHADNFVSFSTEARGQHAEKQTIQAISKLN